MTKYLMPILFGLLGVSILLYLGIWQIQRLQWKQEKLDKISAMMSGIPEDIPKEIDPILHQYLPVKLSGTILDEKVFVLTSRPPIGPGYRLISKFRVNDRFVLLDRGFVKESNRNQISSLGLVNVTGNLLWPNEVDSSFTPEPDIEKNLWFARDLASLSNHFQTEPVLIVARSVNPEMNQVLPWPIDTTGIPNNHLQYAITWFFLSIIWLGMTAYWISRMKRRRE